MRSLSTTINKNTILSLELSTDTEDDSVLKKFGWKMRMEKNFFSQKLVYKTNLKHCNVPHLAPEMIESVYTVISVIYYISVI